MKLLLMIIICSSAYGGKLFADNWEAEWHTWKLKHGKVYVSEEEMKRQLIWERNLRHVLRHNYEYDLGKHSYQLGMNKFADMTSEEFKAFFMGVRGDLADDICLKNVSFNITSSLPESVDWRKGGYVTEVKDQMECGSCWAFSATGSLEGQHYKKTGKLVSLSEQNLVDCSTEKDDQGCSGGLMTSAFEYVRNSGGLDTEESYPYHGKKEQCHFKKSDIGATVTGCVDVPSEDEKALKVAVAKVGPISVAIDASHRSFQLYKQGVYYEANCNSKNLDHGVLVVGYGTEDGNDYWMVKNSWGKAWGVEKGYIRMARNKNNHCGIATLASYPLV